MAKQQACIFYVFFTKMLPFKSKNITLAYVMFKHIRIGIMNGQFKRGSHSPI